MKRQVIKAVVIFGALFMVMAFNVPEQGNRLLRTIQERLSEYSKNTAPEKTYLHTDKERYTSGDTLWFKSYLVDGISHQRSDKSRVAYIELLDASDSLMATRKLFVDTTSAWGDIVIDTLLPEGNYTLRSYTKYMLNDKETPLFEKEITVVKKRNKKNKFSVRSSSVINSNTSGNRPNSNDGIDLRFFPEGGNLVDGLPGVLGIEAIDASGNGLAIQGSIRTEDGTIVKEFESAEFGLGKMNFTPEPNETYYASILHNGAERIFDIPAPLKSGYGLNVRNRGDDLIIQVSATADNSLDGSLLVGHLRGHMILERVGKSQDQGDYGIKVVTESLPKGVASFTLFSPDGRPICERLVFIDHPKSGTQVSIKTDTTLFGTRGKVAVDINVTDGNGAPLQGDFSLSVASLDDRSKEQPLTLKSWLLLDSDLGGTVKDPNFFFRNSSKHTKYMLDALMLTHGWRRFVWKDLLEKKIEAPLTYEPEKGIMITGAATNFKEKSSLKNGLITLNSLENTFEDQQLINQNEKFSFGPYIFNDTLDVVLQTMNTNRGKKPFKTKADIKLDATWPSVQVKRKSIYSSQPVNSGLTLGEADEAFSGDAINFESGTKKVTLLKEVTVRSRKKSLARRINEEIDKTTPYGAPNIRVFRDSVMGWESLSVLELLERKGALMGGAPNSISAAASKLITIDGVYTDFSMIEYMRAAEVRYIDVVRGYNPGASIYGSRGVSGVIAIYTNVPREVESLRESLVPGLFTTKVPGFYKAREFYAPSYVQNTKKGEGYRQDLRSTLFWEPKLVSGKDGSSKVQFYTGDLSGQYIINLEGIADDGSLVQGSYEFGSEGLEK